MRIETGVLPERYSSPERIGRGAMGDIYRALDTLLDRVVAAKLLAERYAEDKEIRERFTREGLAAARLSGEPGIVTIFDVGEWQGRPFIVMEYLPGGSLDERLQAGVPDVGQSLAWLEQAARALDAGHRGGVVHRDVKPANLLLDANDEIHVADFGIASATGLDSLTMTGTVLGTAGYLAPEQAVGERATEASDRYALAAVAWELLAGRRPFASESATAEAAAHAHAPAPSLCTERPDLPCRELDEVFARGLAKDPRQRPASCGELVADLRHALASGATTTRVLPRAPAATPRGRRRFPGWWIAAGALLAAALVAGAALAAAMAGDDTPSAAPTTSVRVKTVTQPGTTVTTPVTVTASTTQATSTSPATSTPPSGSDGVALTDEATALLEAGDYAGAAAKAQQALQALGGTGELYEAYALYDLGAALANLGQCKEAKQALEQSQKIQGHRSEIDSAKDLCKGNGKKRD